jgi:hypothetical protein
MKKILACLLIILLIPPSSFAMSKTMHYVISGVLFVGGAYMMSEGSQQVVTKTTPVYTYERLMFIDCNHQPYFYTKQTFSSYRYEYGQKNESEVLLGAAAMFAGVAFLPFYNAKTKTVSAIYTTKF